MTPESRSAPEALAGHRRGLVDSVQRVVDALGAELRRSVAVDDLDGELIAASRHYGEEDPARTEIVLNRCSGQGVLTFLRGQGMADWTVPTRVPGCESIGLKPRLCYPIRDLGGMPYFLWIIDDGIAVCDERVAEACSQLALILDCRQAKRRLDHKAVAAMLAAILQRVAEPEVVEEVLDREPVMYARRVQLLAFAMGAASDRLESFQAQLRGSLLDHVDVFGDTEIHRVDVSGYHVLVVSYLSSMVGHTTCLAELASDPWRRCGLDAVGALVGVSDPGSIPRLRELYAQAVASSLAARELLSVAEPLSWSQLGYLQSVIRAGGVPPRTAQIEALVELLDADRDRVYGPTLTRYLANCGDSVRTAADLHIHRTTLYYRLGQVTKRTGIDLDDGRQRFTIHHLLFRRALDATDVRLVFSSSSPAS